MQQYYDIKQNYQEAIVFFRMGDFYEMFEDDAQIAHNILGITLTTRNKNAENPILLAGIPYHAKDKYLPRLIEAGYKVAIVEQVSDPKAKWIVEREVVRVVTPATVSIEGEWYELSSQKQWLLSLCCINNTYAMSFYDTVWNTWTCSEFWDFESCSIELYKSQACEVILEKDLFWNTEIHEILEKKYGLHISYFQIDIQSPYKYLCELFSTENLEAFWIEERPLAQQAATLLHMYFCDHQKSYISHMRRLSYESYQSYMKLDPATIKSLDLVYNIHTASKTQWSLFGAINDTKTPMWKRFLYDSILHPLQDEKEIKKRQKYMLAWGKDQILLENVRQELGKIWDLESLLSRFMHKRVQARDLLKLKHSLIAIKNIYKMIEESWNKTLKQELLTH